MPVALYCGNIARPQLTADGTTQRQYDGRRSVASPLAISENNIYIDAKAQEIAESGVFYRPEVHTMRLHRLARSFA